jgi:hypothetical protein
MSGSPLFPPLLADMGIPMIVLTFPAMVILLIPVVVVEALLCKKWLGLTTWQSMKANALSNLASMIGGIPVAWVVMVILQFAVMAALEGTRSSQQSNSPMASTVVFLLSPAWLPPVGRNLWLIPAAVLLILVPFFFVSYGIEYAIVRKMVGSPTGEPPNLAYPRVKIAVRNANLVTYGAMFVGTSVWLIVEVFRELVRR